MNFFQAIALGLLQGITEFLPISSTAHMTLAAKIMGIPMTGNNSAEWTAFMAVVQLGTLASVLIYFRLDIIGILSAFFTNNLLKPKKFALQSTESRLGWYIIIGSIPVVVIGLAMKKIIEGDGTKNLYVIASSLIALAIILGIAEKTAKLKKNLTDCTLKEVLVIGFSQALALIPGSSRSGTTITAGLFMGLNREAAARFSFLLSIPAVFGSGLFELKHVLKEGSIHSHDLYILVLATVVAFVSGYLAIDLLLKFLRKNTTFVFIFYRIILGTAILGLLFAGKI